MKWWGITLLIWTVINLSVVLWLGWSYLIRECDWCHKRYYYWTSTSSAKNVFCSYRCNYWDLRAYLADEMDLDIADVEQYLSKRGYMHPDLMEKAR